MEDLGFQPRSAWRESPSPRQHLTLDLVLSPGHHRWERNSRLVLLWVCWIESSWGQGLCLVLFPSPAPRRYLGNEGMNGQAAAQAKAPRSTGGDPEGHSQGRCRAQEPTALGRSVWPPHYPASSGAHRVRGDGPVAGSRRPRIEYQWLSP